MTNKFLYIIDYSILGFQHLIYVLEYIYIISLYSLGQLETLPNKFSTISLIPKHSNFLPNDERVFIWNEIIFMTDNDLPPGFIAGGLCICKNFSSIKERLRSIPCTKVMTLQPL